MKIGLDFDGLIANNSVVKAFVAKEVFGVEVSPEECKKELIVGRGLMTHAEYRELQELASGTRHFGLQMPAVEGALEGIHRLLKAGHDLTVVTSRDGTHLAVAEEWADNMNLDLVFVGVGWKVSKAGALRGFDVFVDDDFDKLEPLVGLVPNRFLFHWPYNEHIDTGHVATRIRTWQEFCSRVAALS